MGENEPASGSAKEEGSMRDCAHPSDLHDDMQRELAFSAENQENSNK